jgi:protein-L-isoaspartate(D-aspartate) O-methyltransferase
MTRPRDRATDLFAVQRKALVEHVKRDVARYGIGDGSHELDPRVAEAMIEVPREAFVPPDLREFAFENRPLPIGHGQTISQPLIVAVMTHLLYLTPESRVLEVGTGSGYQAAILAELAARVVSLEIVEPLAEQAAAKLAALGYDNVACHAGDGGVGWPAEAPYQGIIVTAAAATIPPALLQQLDAGGRLVAPLGGDALSQDLVLVEKDASGQIHQRQLFPVAFVPLTGASTRA